MVKISKLDHFGRGIFYDDKICFVANALPDEEVNVSLVKESKKYKEYKVDSIIKSSPNRVIPKCPYYEICGGCNLEHMSYKDTLTFKINKVKEIFNKFNINYKDISIIDNPFPFNYRNKIELKSLNNQLGYYKDSTHEIVPIKNCVVASKPINDAIKEISDLNIGNYSVVIRSNYNDELLLWFKSNEDISLSREMFSSDLKIASIMINDRVIYGEDHLIMKVDKYLFKCSYDAFFQINPFICEKIADFIKNNIPKDKIIADLYCGVGFLGILAALKAKKVYGIEIVDNAIKDAIMNAKINKIDNMYFMLGNVSNIFNKIEDKIDYLIVDPPRSGLDKDTINTIINDKIPNIFYMSCDPNTLARDLALLQDYYNIKTITCLDMFSYTYHVETICILERK